MVTFLFFKQKTAYDMRMSDWSSDVCSSDLSRAGSSRNSSRIDTPRGLAARGLRSMTTSSGAITVRDQYDTFDRWKGNQRGSSMISTGITGTARHGTCPKRARAMRVKTLLWAAPQAARMAARARAMYAASGSSDRQRVGSAKSVTVRLAIGG